MTATATTTENSGAAAGTPSSTPAAPSPGPGGSAAETPGGDKPGGDKPPGDKPGDAKSDGSKPNEADATPKVIRRDSLKVDPTNAEELKRATLGDDQRVAFEFRNQGWPELIEWLSALSGQPIDWQELPGDRVNVTTPGRYTVDEVRDLLNRHLLSRGYTLLALDGGYTIVKCDAINPALVPRVEESELTRIEDHTFVRVSLEVGWLSAEKLATELKPMMSKNGTLTALSTTNRIEAMDAAVTLRDLATLLAQERSLTRREQLAPEFRLRYLPAPEAKVMLEQFLGIEKKKEKPLTPQEMMQLQQMQQQHGGQPPQPDQNKATISIVANHRQNSLIIQAPQDRVAIAMEFLKRIDIPNASVVSLAEVQNRVQVFRLETIDPEKLLEIVQEMNILEPTTQTRVDAENGALIVSGSAADRYIISQLIQRLDGSGRRFEVMQLRRLDATEVAESISFLMGEKKEDKDEGRRNRFSYYFGMDNSSDEKKEKDHFRVAANARYRQVLLWANDSEMAEVRNLLVKLGELPPPEGDGRTLRVIEASATPETLDYLRRLKQQFELTAPNTLELPEDSEFEDPLEQMRDEMKRDAQPQDKNALPPAENRKPPGGSKKDVTFNINNPAASQQTQFLTALQSDEVPESDDAGTPSDAPEINSAEEFDRQFGPGRAPSNQQRSLLGGQREVDSTDQGAGHPKSTPRAGNAKDRPPVVIQLDQAGNLVLSSADTAALDQLENLMLQFAPPKRPYHVFKLQYASASWVKLNLQDYYKDGDKKDSSADNFFRWYWGDGEEEKEEDPAGLGKGVKLRFVDDLDTNTIVVNGADREQLRTIDELIRLWDVPPPVDRRKTRFTKLVQVRYGKAQLIADTVKDAYRDLLSSNDKAFQQQAQGGQTGGNDARGRTPRNRDGNGSSLVNSSSDLAGGGSDFTFRGKLSMGVDTLGNTLVVSAEGESLLELVCDMIKQLDDASRPSGDVQVMRISGMISGDSLESALRAFSSGKTPTLPDATPGETADRTPGAEATATN